MPERTVVAPVAGLAWKNGSLVMLRGRNPAIRLDCGAPTGGAGSRQGIGVHIEKLAGR